MRINSEATDWYYCRYSKPFLARVIHVRDGTAKTRTTTTIKNKAKSRAGYEANPERRPLYATATYKADPEKKGSVHDSYNTDIESKCRCP